MSHRRPPQTSVERAVKEQLAALDMTLADAAAAYPAAAWALGVVVNGKPTPQPRAHLPPCDHGVDDATMTKPSVKF